VSTLVPHLGNSSNFSFRSAKFAASHLQLGSSAALNSCSTVALSVEFVAKPEKARSATTFLPKAILRALKEVAGFAGCVVMSSDQEARLVTVIIFWSGNDCHRRCRENVRWVRALLAGYVDRCLRVQTLLAHAALSSEYAVEANDVETNGAETGLFPQEAAPADETVCVA